MRLESFHRFTSQTALVGALTVLALFLGTVTVASAEPSIPHTPAGKALAAWLTAFNSGDRRELESYYGSHQPDAPGGVVDFDMRAFRDMGGFDLLSVRRSEPQRIEYLVIGRGNRVHVLGELEVSNSDPPHVTKNPIYIIPPGAFIIGFRIDAAVRARVIRAVANELNHLYVQPNLGKKMALDIRARWRRGEYDSITEGDTLARQLTKDLRAISHDGHLRVSFSPARLPAAMFRPSSAAAARERESLEHTNCGFVRAEWLPGNVGYLRFDEFGDPTVCKATAAAAMSFLANVDAIIFDLRENHGGDPALVAFVESYLFASPTHLDDFWDRQSSRMTHTWTLANVPGKRLPSVPVYILVSHGTFSGGEAFAYELQALKRATVVGEVTGGGGHLVHPVRIGARFTLAVPSAEPINPITKTNWEGTGVFPDVKVPAAQALDVAEKLAVAELSRIRAARETTTQAAGPNR